MGKVIKWTLVIVVVMCLFYTCVVKSRAEKLNDSAYWQAMNAQVLDMVCSKLSSHDYNLISRNKGVQYHIGADIITIRVVDQGTRSLILIAVSRKEGDRWE